MVLEQFLKQSPTSLIHEDFFISSIHRLNLGKSQIEDLLKNQLHLTLFVNKTFYETLGNFYISREMLTN